MSTTFPDSSRFRPGHLTVPQEQPILGDANDGKILSVPDAEISIEPIKRDEDNSDFSNYMIQSFFQEAKIPGAIGLYESHLQNYPYLMQEIGENF